MSKVSCTRGDENERLRFIGKTLGAWASEHEALLGGLDALRRIGPDAADVVRAVMELQDVRTFRLSWELFEALAQGAAIDPDAVLHGCVSHELVDLVGSAVFGRTNGVALELVSS